MRVSSAIYYLVDAIIPGKRFSARISSTAYHPVPSAFASMNDDVAHMFYVSTQLALTRSKKRHQEVLSFPRRAYPPILPAAQRQRAERYAARHCRLRGAAKSARFAHGCA